MIKKVLVVYDSLSGNTHEVAELIKGELEASGVEVTAVRVGGGFIPSPADYDLLLVGTYTWDKGSLPIEMKDTVYDIGYKPENVEVFGTGDTQFGGDELFCRACDKLAKFYNSKHEVLKIEQSPRGSQERRVIDWTQSVMELYDIKSRQKQTA